jgi:hypothetical protein
VSSVGKAWAIVRSRMTGNKAKAQGLLDSIPERKRREINRQESRARGSRRNRKAYRLGERRR